ncbi:MAG: EVE domain-containing protein [Bacteroidales bacterium]
MFTWVSTHKAIANKLYEYQNRQPELIRLLKDASEAKLNDKDKKGQHIELEEIDPFSFFCFIYKVGPSNQIKRLQHIARHFNLSPLPSDTCGLPSTNALKVMMFPFLEHGENNEIDRLWNFFKAAMNEQITDSLFDDILSIEGAGRTKITETLFYVKPDKYLPINKQSKPYLKEILKINPEFKTFSDYKNIMQKAKEASGDPFYKISYDAWKWNTSEKSQNYWIFQATPDQYDLVASLKEKALKTWSVTTHKDKITKGDKVILWITGSKAGCYALCTVASEVKTRKDNKEELKYYISPVNNTEGLKVELDIDVNLAENPVLKEQLKGKKEFYNFIKGIRGTNIKATKKQYKIISEMVDPKKNNIQYWLYAPGENAKMWNEFYNQGIMGIGWSELGDLNEYETKEDIRKKLQEIEGSKSKKTNDTNTNYDFKEGLKQNDVVIVKKGTEKYLGYGVIASDYYYDDTQSKYKKCRKVNWKKKGEWPENKDAIPLKTLTKITHQ